MSDLFKVFILGIVEGITEFLPISSTGHLIVAAALLDFRGATGGTFEIFIQLGAVLAVIWYYRSDLLRQIVTVHRDAGVQRLWLAILIAFIPAAVLGILFKDWIKAALFNPSVVALSLIVGGIIFLVIERRPAAPSTTQTLNTINWRQAVGIGIAQTTALIPGVSRSGASIIGGMLFGLNRQTATQFSFYLAIPTLGGATLFELVTSLDKLQSDDMVALLIGAAVSGVVAWLSISWLLRYISRNNFVAFGYYRIAAGMIILLLIISGILK